VCNFLEWRDYKLCYKRYASLFFIACIENTDNELVALETVHHFVECLDRYFGNVCELDLIFNFHKAYYILDEIIIAGELQESSKRAVLQHISEQDAMTAEADIKDGHATKKQLREISKGRGEIGNGMDREKEDKLKRPRKLAARLEAIRLSADQRAQSRCPRAVPLHSSACDESREASATLAQDKGAQGTTLGKSFAGSRQSCGGAGNAAGRTIIGTARGAEHARAVEGRAREERWNAEASSGFFGAPWNPGGSGVDAAQGAARAIEHGALGGRPARGEICDRGNQRIAPPASAPAASGAAPAQAATPGPPAPSAPPPAARVADADQIDKPMEMAFEERAKVCDVLEAMASWNSVVSDELKGHFNFKINDAEERKRAGALAAGHGDDLIAGGFDERLNLMG
ncbi:unnamed protein product, partial [Prorocentrum cordatum]